MIKKGQRILSDLSNNNVNENKLVRCGMGLWWFDSTEKDGL